VTVDDLGSMGGGMSRVKAVASSADLKKALGAAGKKLVVVDFFATWCGPCKQIAPAFAELSGQHKKVVFLKVDVDQCKDLAASYGVSSMPTFLFLRNGKVLSKLAGANIDG
jgi:thioredoxin 1